MNTDTLIEQTTVKQSLKALEKELIKKMVGCFTVDFKFVETFAPEKDYKYDERYFESAKEYTYILDETEDKISIQHILLINQEKGIRIKHWRQDWLYENRECLSYSKDNEWKKIQLTPQQAKDTWTQKVYQVDDSPRYEGYGVWVHRNGRHYWDMVTDAPLPRRELKKGRDYNVLNRQCRVEIYDNGNWRLEQDNLKIKRDQHLNDHLICMEKGLEIFTVTPFDTEPFKEWWQNQENFWAEVRAFWAEHINQNDTIKINYEIDGTLLYQVIFKLAEQFSGERYDSVKAKSALQKVFKKHVVNYKL